MRALTLLLALTGCPGAGDDTSKIDDTSKTDDSGHTGDSGGPCGESGICALTVTEATGTCGEDPVGTASALSASADGPGAVRVTITNAATGCCPTVDGTGEASQRSGELSVTWSITSDPCDCVCSLDVGLRLEGVPAGTWTVLVSGLSTTVTTE